jgi:hypothetical protein
MKKLRRNLATFGIITVLSTLWVIRYNALNAAYSRRDVITATYAVGDVVPFDKDYISWGMTAAGYSMSVDSFSIMDYDECIEFFNLSPNSVADELSPPERVGIATVTLYNDTSDAPGVMLFELMLHGLDMYSDINLELLVSINPALNGVYGVSLAHHTEYVLYLPYNLRKMHYSTRTWNNMDKRKFWLQLTSFPTLKDVNVQ